MAKTFFLTTIAIVVSSSVNSERRPFLSYSKNLQQAVPHFWKHDQEKLDRNLDKNPGQRWESVRAGPRPPPLRPDSPAPWHFRNHLADKQSTLNRVHQLKNKLIPKNIIHVQALNHPHPKPAVDLKKSLENNKRHKRGLAQADHESRDKREVIINPQIQPEMVMQPHIQPALLQEAENKGTRPMLKFHFYNPSIYYPEVIEKLANNTGHYQDKIIEKRDKRQILLMIKRQPLKMVKKPRTTPNPFIRDTNIADYDIVKPDTYKPEVEIVNSMDSDSYQLNEEASEISKIMSNFYLMTSSENWPEIQQFSEKVLKPLSELLDARVNRKHSNHVTVTGNDDRYTTTSEASFNRRVKRKLDKTLIRKRAKKRKQKARRVERKRLRMRTHARRLRKQRKSKLARLERHYARMNLTTTVVPNLEGNCNISKKTHEAVTGHTEKGVVTISKSKSYESDGSQTESSYDDSEEGSDDEYYDSSEEEENDLDLESDDGNDEYEEYDDDSSSNSFEYVDYENVEDEPDKSNTKNKKGINKKQAISKEKITKGNIKIIKTKKGKKS